MSIKAIIFDYVGTLVTCGGYSIEASRKKLYYALLAEGFEVEEDKFMSAYTVAHEKYRKVRYEQFVEVTNAIWVAEALVSLGFQVSAEDSRITAGLNVFFQDFIDNLELREGAKKLLKQAAQRCKVGLISNFTHAPVIYKSLGKLKINEFFNVVTVSEENGHRKPHSEIFEDALSKLAVEANEVVYIGDSPIEDIKGAKCAGFKTVFVTSQFNSLKDLAASKQKPDYIAQNLPAVSKTLTMLYKD
jgi:HAD superfamily hydrolase (TIGR01549 family)